LEDACWPGYEAIGLKPGKGGRMVPNCVPVKNSKQRFESYNDYPESAKAAAKRALEWRDAHPDQKCGTPVGWARANQLAKGENISEETIARMASFARHLQYKDVPYSEGCGGLMVDAWGGQAGIEWASNKLESIRTEMQDEREINVLGYNTRHFKLCPGAIATFQHLVSMNPNEEVAGMIRSAAIQADTVFAIEQRVLDAGVATLEDLYEATLIVKDFFDLMAEIDALVGMEHNIDYMYGHLDVIGNLVPDEDFAIDTSGLPVYVDEITEDKKKKDDLITVAILKAAARLGFSYETFANAEIAPNIGNSDDIEELQEYAGKDSGFTIYKYEGPSPQRQFCRQMMGLNRWYTYQDIKEMESIAVNSGFGAGGSSTYSIWKYKGGVNCKHRWQKYYVNVTDNKLENKGPALGLAGERANSGNNWYRMENAYHFAEDKRIVTGPLMIPNMEIPRKAEDGSKYYVYFTEDGIESIARKFMKQKLGDSVTLEHGNKTSGVYLTELWLVESSMKDKSNLYNFTLPKGTLFGIYKI
jgi:hypothetical protein